jgi:hypothetical protein
MYCPKCYGNNAFPAHDVNYMRDIIICPKCGEVSWPMPSMDELAQDVERIKERMRSIPNMPVLEKEE